MILDATLEYRVCILVSLLNHDNFSTEYFINVITGDPLGAEGPGQLPPLPPPLIRPCLISKDFVQYQIYSEINRNVCE